MEQALRLMIDFERQGEAFNRRTRERLAQWKAMPGAAREARVSLDFLTTDLALKEAGSVQGLAQGAQGVRLSVLSHSETGGVALAQVEEAQLGRLYRQAHRWDGVKASAQRVLGSAFPHSAGLLAQGLGRVVASPVAAARGLSMPGGALAAAGAVLQWRLHLANEEALERLGERLRSQHDLTAAQREVIEESLALTRLGNYDNYCGMSGGALELTGLGMGAMRLAGTSAGLLVAAGLAGAGGAFMNAAQSFLRAQGKFKESEKSFGRVYLLVGGFYSMAGVFGIAASVEIGAHWVLERKLLETGLRAGGQASGRLIAGRFGYGLALRGLSLTGVGLLLTVVAFGIEGIVAYYDRSKLEAWVEQCYFGSKPKWRAQSKEKDKGWYIGKSTPVPENLDEDPVRWESEAAAFARALEEANAEGATL